MQADGPQDLKGLTLSDRRAYSVIVNGRGHKLRGTDGATADAAGELARRALAGLDMLEWLGLGGAHPVSDKSSIVLLRTPGARRLTLVFAGNSKQFALPIELIGRQDTHLLLIRDPHRCFALSLIYGLGDSFQACLLALRRIVGVLEVESLYVAGVSAGAAGGLRFACDLGAAGYLGFSLPTTLDLNDDPGAELRNYPQLTLLYRRNRNMGIDFARYYATTRLRPRAMLVFSDAHIRDSWLARRMEHIEGVKLYPTIGFSGHNTYHHTITNQLLTPFLDRLYELTPIHLPSDHLVSAD